MTEIKFGTVIENVVTREEFTLEMARKQLAKEKIAIIGYGVQGPAQAMNLRDNNFSVIIGQRENTESWQKAIQDGWIPGKTLYSIKEACNQATCICNLLSDAAQVTTWQEIKPTLTEGKTLYFSHGFGITYNKQTEIIPPKHIDVILVAPKGSGRSVRKLFLQGQGINSSYAVYQDYSGQAKEKALAIGIAIGSGYLFETTFIKEVYSDLCGERGVLMGALAGIIQAQYQVLRDNGHSPSEAFNETVEELTQSLVPLVGENGMDWMYANCSTTAQRGALDWRNKFMQAVKPVFNDLYESVRNGTEAKIVIQANSQSDYKQKLQQELDKLGAEEVWQAGKQIRKLRPKIKEKGK
jgi:ketol-acid reductoisomerase